MVEFSIIALPLLLLGLGSVEAAHWYYTRQALSLALLDAGRAAITDHNRPARIITAFETSLRPLYAAPKPSDISQRLRDALASRQHRMQDAPWQIEVLSPSASAYADFSDAGLHIDGASGRSIINNHYLAEQDHINRTKGWLDGRGPVSGQTIYDANTVVLRLSWLHEPRLPLIRSLLRTLGNPRGNYRQRGFSKGYLPMTRQITMVMQSHPVHWSDDPAGKVLFHPENEVQHLTCPGWLCNSQTDSPATRSDTPDYGIHTSDVPASDVPVSAIPDHATPADSAPMPIDLKLPALAIPDGSSYSNQTVAPATPGVDPDDPLCGVVLCCV